jgi:hypothetical protein
MQNPSLLSISFAILSRLLHYLLVLPRLGSKRLADDWSNTRNKIVKFAKRKKKDVKLCLTVGEYFLDFRNFI